jgi:PKD repeat protein
MKGGSFSTSSKHSPAQVPGTRGRRWTQALLLPLAIAALFSLAPRADAYEQYSLSRNAGNCADCHGNFGTSPYLSFKDGTSWGNSLHFGHWGMVSNDCNACHQPPTGTPRFPVFLDLSAGGTGFEAISCMGCHGRNEDIGGDEISQGRGRGLRQHHENAGITSCGDCHSDSDGPPGVGEEVPPPYYFTPDTAHSSKPTDACDANGSESVFGATGLDNDGDILEDADDADCAGNMPPTADADGPYSGTVGAAVAFDGSGSADPDGTVVAYDWDFGDGGTGTGVNPTHSYATDGVFTVTLTVSDDGGLTDSDTTSATITFGLLAPTADPDGPYSGTVGSAVAFDGSGSSDDSAIVAYDWDFGDGGTGTGVSPNHTYATAGLFNVTLTVTDDDGLTDSAATNATIEAAPLPPTADPDGPYSGTVGTAVVFDGSGSADPDGSIVTYAWDFGDGGTGTGVSPSHTYVVAGSYAVSLTVTDDDGLSDTAATTANIAETPMEPPVADPNGPYSGTPGSAVVFDGSGSVDPDGSIVAYDWDFGDGGTGTGVSPSHTYAAAGVYTVSLTVTDDDGQTDTAATTANIAETPMEPPVADPNGPYSGTVGTAVVFDGSGSADPDGSIVTYAWDFGDGGTGTGVSPSHTYAAAGVYTVSLTVTDDDGLSDTAATTANIAEAPMEPPVADPNGPYSGTPGSAVAFDGSGSFDPDGTILTYAWDFGDGNTGMGESPSHTYAAAGSYTVSLTVTDDDGQTDTATTTAEIAEIPLEPPVADPNGPYSGTVGTAVTFDGTGSVDPDGSIVAYDWDFGDGNTGTGATPTHSYATDAVFTVMLRVTDDDGLTDTAATTATIGLGPLPPVADPNGPYSGTVGSPVQFDGTGSSDPNGDGTIVAYDWDFGDGGSGTGPTPSYAYAAPGLYSVTLTVTDDGGLSDSASTTADISDDGFLEVDALVPGAINPGNRGVTPIKFLADMPLNIKSVVCGPADAEPERLNRADVNGDDLKDVVGLFKTRDLGIACGDQTLMCTGVLAGGMPFLATSSPFRTVGGACKLSKLSAKKGQTLDMSESSPSARGRDKKRR